MSFRKLLLAGAALAVGSAAMAAPASASVIDRPHFKVLGVVIVWGASDDGTNAGQPIANDFIIGDTNDTDLIATDGRTVVTGSLTPTADAAAIASNGFAALGLNGTEIGDADGDLDLDDTFSAFDVTGQSLTGDALTYDSSFYVASNTVFGITAEVTDSTVDTAGDFDLSDVSFAFDATLADAADATGFGSAAYNDLTNTATGVPTDLDALNTAGPTTVFTSDKRTAENAGNIIAQSIRLDATYTLGSATGYDLSQGAGSVEAEVTFTAFVP